MNVSLDVHRLGGLRWIVLRGPGREAFRAYTIGDREGRIVGVEAAAGRYAVTEAGPLLWHTNHGRYLPGAEPSAGGSSAVRGQTLAALSVPAQEPGMDWFLDVLAGQPFPGSVRCDPGTGRCAVTLCTFVADLTAGEAVIAVQDQPPVAIPLRDLAEGHPHAQRSFIS